MGEPIPAVAGTVQHMTVTGLASGTLYYFAMKSQDGVPNISLISNVAHLSTLSSGGGGVGGGGGGVSSPPPSAPPPVPAPAPTPLSTGNYSANEALNLSPTIDADLGSASLHAGTLASCAAGSLIKIADDQNPLTQTDSPVYYCGADGRRYVFPSASTYFSWYSNFNDVQIISAQAMAEIPLGFNNVTIRPGARLAKFPTNAKIYAVSPAGILRWVVDEPTAAALYGSDQNKWVLDVSDDLFVNYRFGADITLALVTPGSIPPSGAPVVLPVSAPAAAVCSAPAAFTQSSAFGASGTEVLALQKLLLCLGDFPANIAPNGNFGPVTEQALKQFQTTNGLPPVGFVGPATLAALNRYLSQ
jgi:hypothetical protein